MSTRIEDLTEGFSWNQKAVFLSLLLAFFMLPFLFLLAIDRQIVAAAYLAIPIILLLVALPRHSFYLFIVVNFIYLPFYMKGFAIHLGDICAMIFLAAVSISWLLRGSGRIDKTPFDIPIIVLIAATAVSGIFAYQRGLSIVPIGRIIIVLLAFRAFYYLSKHYGISKMVHFYILALSFFSAVNVINFGLLAGTTRIFGISGIAFETLLMAGVPINFAYAIWADNGRRQMTYTLLLIINLLASLATMSRGLLITLAISLPVLMCVSSRRARKLNLERPRRYIRKWLAVTMPLAVVAIIAGSFLTPLLSRFGEMLQGRATGTILLRFTLWKAALSGFLTSPITGIGIGNFRVIDYILPQLKFEPVRYYLVGMSFHNVFLQYLCETGILGAGALVWLMSRTFVTGKRIINLMTGSDDVAASMAAYICGFILLITTFYMRAWTWGQEGYVFAFMLAILASQCSKLREKGSTID